MLYFHHEFERGNFITSPCVEFGKIIASIGADVTLRNSDKDADGVAYQSVEFCVAGTVMAEMAIFKKSKYFLNDWVQYRIAK